MKSDEGDFTLSKKVVNSDSTVYIGKINNKQAIYVVPKPTIPENVFFNSLNSKQEVVQKNGIYSTIKSESTMEIGYNLIYPASNEDVEKYTSEGIFVSETYDEYLKLMSEKKNVDTEWIDNLIKQPNQPNEKVYYNDSEFMIVKDYTWVDNEKENMHILVLFKDTNLKTLRDIKNIQLLERVDKAVNDTLKSLNISENTTFSFFNYRPTYFRLILHITGKSVFFSPIASAVTAIPFKAVCDVLKKDINYFTKTFRVFELK